MSRTIIALTGTAQAGKDTAGDYLVNKYGFTKVGFADQLKQAVYILNPIVAYEPELGYIRFQEIIESSGWEEAKKLPEVRRLLQVMGTEVGREMFGTNFWVEQTARKIEGLGKDKIVITDTRFINESEFVRNSDFDTKAVVKIFNSRITPPNKHKSEDGIPTEFTDTEIYNEGTVEELYNSIEKFLATYSI